MQVTEIFRSVQGESSWTGLPCTFIRLTGCPLRCRWCDTVYSFKGGETMSIEAILGRVKEYGVNLVEVTGGEPLAHPQVEELIDRLIGDGYEVLIETSGSEPIAHINKKAHLIMDIKCPGSGMDHKNRWENLEHIEAKDEIKFVIASRADYEWARNVIKERKLEDHCTLLMSPAWGLLKPEELTEWFLTDGLRVRMNLQIHKVIWSPRKRGV